MFSVLFGPHYKHCFLWPGRCETLQAEYIFTVPQGSLHAACTTVATDDCIFMQPNSFSPLPLQEVFEDLNITSTPVFLFFKNEEMVRPVCGPRSGETFDLVDWPLQLHHRLC